MEIHNKHDVSIFITYFYEENGILKKVLEEEIKSGEQKPITEPKHNTQFIVRGPGSGRSGKSISITLEQKSAQSEYLFEFTYKKDSTTGSNVTVQDDV